MNPPSDLVVFLRQADLFDDIIGKLFTDYQKREDTPDELKMAVYIGYGVATEEMMIGTPMEGSGELVIYIDCLRIDNRFHRLFFKFSDVYENRLSDFNGFMSMLNKQIWEDPDNPFVDVVYQSDYGEEDGDVD